MVVHEVSVDLFVDADVFFSPEVIRVTRPDQLAPALAQRTKAVVIDNPEMEKRFQSMQAWANVRFIGTLIALLIAFAIAQGKHEVALSLKRDWKQNTLEGKITLTPIERK